MKSIYTSNFIEAVNLQIPIIYIAINQKIHKTSMCTIVQNSQLLQSCDAMIIELFSIIIHSY